ncbi:MAG: DUF2232 domain-containing protein [Alphaproteobacteria bacterium]|nr:DUF2232 domain-containing protein [Alphaproteobacteria bacterium]
MMQIVLIGLCAGATSALLFASVVSGTTLSFLLANFAQLPILIAAIGWTQLAGLSALLIATAGLALTLGSTIAFAFFITIGLPAWWIGYLALLARPAPAQPDGIEWYPVGRIVVWTAILAAAVTLASMLRYGLDVTQMQAGLRRELEQALRFLTGASREGPLELPSVKSPDRLLDLLTIIVPPMKAVAVAATSLTNLWLAGRIVRTSGRLRRPWPAIAEMTFPAFAPAVLAVAVALTFLPDILGLTGSIFGASLLLAYALLGLAVLHAVTAGVGGRGVMLGGLYLSIVLFGWPLILMAALGLIETLASLRARVAARRALPPSVNR